MQVVILAGGLATRMRPETDDTPKSLLPVNGRPFVDWQLDRLAASGVRSVVMCVGHLGEQIETHVKRSLERGLTVGYSYDGEQLSGTGGALRRAFARHGPDALRSGAVAGAFSALDPAIHLAETTGKSDACVLAAQPRSSPWTPPRSASSTAI